MSTLAPLPGWALKLHGSVERFTESGLTGLVDHASVTNPLGELLARREVTPARLQEFLDSLRESQGATAPSGLPAGGQSPMQDILGADPQKFWSTAWQDILSVAVRVFGNTKEVKEIVIPPFPTLKVKAAAAFMGGLGHWIPVFLPANLTEADYPAEFVKPDWGKYLTVSSIQRRPLPGRWVMVETIGKPNWNDQNGYGNGNDSLGKALGLTTRFRVSWDGIKDTHLKNLAKSHFGLSKKAVRLPTAEEWNLIGNLFLWLNRHRNMALPDLGSTDSWEWCENACGVDYRLVVGYRDNGGLAGVGGRWLGGTGGYIGFRVLAVL